MSILARWAVKNNFFFFEEIKMKSWTCQATLMIKQYYTRERNYYFFFIAFNIVYSSSSFFFFLSLGGLFILFFNITFLKWFYFLYYFKKIPIFSILKFLFYVKLIIFSLNSNFQLLESLHFIFQDMISNWNIKLNINLFLIILYSF